MMHSSFSIFNGFLGQPGEVIDRVLNVIGSKGNLLMMSMPYTGSSYEYLKQNQTFDVRKTPSKMGIITEIFRRRPDVLRSLNPIHPLLAYGSRAKWIIDGHEKLHFSCGAGSPFEKLLELDGKGFFFDVGYLYFTFNHHLEHLFKDRVPLQIYHEHPLESVVIDGNGNRHNVLNFVFNTETIQKRNFSVLEDELLHSGIIKRITIGNIKIQVLSIKSVLWAAKKMFDAGRGFYNLHK